jgi:APA family basic amino acid/polyamine antiporter
MADLRREIDLPRATLYGVGQILGAGIYAILGEAAGLTGDSVLVSFLLAAIVASFSGLSYAELSSRFPVGEADFVYVNEAFEIRWLSVFTAVIRLLVGVIAAATVALAFAGYLSAFLPASPVSSAIGLIIVMSAINFAGIDLSTKLNVAFVAVEVIGLLIVIWAGAGSWSAVDVFHTPNGSAGLLQAAFLVFFAYIGFEDLVNVTEETENAPITIPRAILLSIGVTTVLYLLVGTSSVAVVDWELLGQSESPLALVVRTGVGTEAGLLVAAIALFATMNTVLINLISTSRLVYGVAKEEHRTFPAMLSRVHASRGTPHLAIATVGVLASAFALIGDVGTVAALANLAMLVLFVLVNTALIRIRFTSDAADPEFRAPFNVGRLPLTAVAGALSASALAVFYVAHAT